MEKEDSFLRQTSLGNSDDSVKYILGVRKIDDHTEYLVRYNNPQMYDVWQNSYDLTCADKILAFYRNENPKSLTPNLDPKSKNTQFEQDLISPDDQFKIFGFEKKEGKVFMRVHVPGKDGIVSLEPKDLYGEYSAEIADYYEENILSEQG